MSAIMVSVVVKVTIILALGLGLTAILRRAPAAFRHVILLGTLASALLLPVFLAIVPRWNVPVLRSSTRELLTTSASATQMIGPTEAGISSAATPPGVESPVAGTRASKLLFLTNPDLSFLLAVTWLLGTLGVLGWLALGHLRLRSLRNKSWPLEDADWGEVLREERERSAFEGNIRVLCHPDVSTPLTWGSFNPVIVLPEDALEWSREHRSIVLRHELAHVTRKDALAQLSAGVVRAIYWFHPLVWIAERRLRAECERACDDSVVAAGTPAPVYAAHLLEVARSARSFGGPGFLSVAMARPSQLEGRLLAVLSESRSRSPVSPRASWLTIASMAAVVLILSAFRPVTRVAESGESPTAKALENAGFQRLENETAVGSPPVIVTTGAVVTPVAGSDSIFERVVDVRSGGTLTLDLQRTGGSITITGWDRAQVLVKARLAGPNWRETEVTLQPQDGGAVLRDGYTGRSSRTSFSHVFDIQVPRTFNVRLSSAGGGISIFGVSGRFTGTTGGGEIKLDNTSGEVDLQSGGGDINVTNSTLRGVVGTGGGTVNIDGGGSELIGSSGSGDITSQTRLIRDLNARLSEVKRLQSNSGSTTTFRSDYADLAKHFGENGIQRDQPGGNITLAEAPNGARVSTGGGAIRIGPSGGEVYASTGGGSIEIGPASGSVIATTGAGNITLTFRGPGPHAADLTSGLGRVELILPANINAQLVLETAYTDNLGHKTRIDSDWPLTTTETDRWDASVGTPRKYVRARQILGTGGRVIRVRTINGNVVVRRADSA